MLAIRIGNYFEIPKVDYEQPAPFTWKEFYNFRNHVLRVLRIFGSAGPMGEVDLSAGGEEDEPSFSAEIVKNPAFFVVDDMYNEHDRISIVECAPANVDAVVIESLCAMMLMFPGWWVSLKLGDSGLLVSSGTVLIGGRRFWDCTSVLEISERCQGPVEFGPSEPLPDSMNDLWRTILIGGIDQELQFPIAPSRQWGEVIRSLEMMRSRRKDGRLTSFAYDQVRNDLHPQTRRELLLRLLHDLPAFAPEMLAAATRNIQRDSGQALTESNSTEAAKELAGRIGEALESISEKLERIEVVNWWANTLHNAKNAPISLKQVLEERMRVDARNSNPLVQLSSLFGLARLAASDVSSLLHEFVVSHPDWSNPALLEWLEKLKTERAGYPPRSLFSAN